MSDVLKQAAAAIREHANEIYESEAMEGGYWPSDAIGQNAKAEWERLIELARNVDSQSATIERLEKANAMAAQSRRQFRESYREIREEMKVLKYRADKFGLALMMIREGCAEPQKFAGEQLAALEQSS